ncbi:sugar phosphate isomerase/epimerase [Treponema sp.]
MLQFGLRAHDIGKLPAEELAEKISAYQPASIQLAFGKALSDAPEKLGALSPGYARRVRETFCSRGIAISVLGCYINPVHPDEEARDQALLRFEEHLRYARDFGCPIVGTETGSCNADCSFHPDTETDKTLDLLCRSLERLLKTAEKYASIVGIEAVAGQHTVSSIERMEKVLRRLDSPNLAVIYDPVNLIPVAGLSERQSDFFSRAFAAFGPKIAAVHVKDFRMSKGIKDGSLPAGKGDLDYRSLFHLLQVEKPCIDVLLENGNPTTLKESLDFVRRVAEQTV